MAKTLRHGRLQDLSLRAKFKEFSVVEITVVDHATGELSQILWDWTSVSKPVTKLESESKVEVEEDESHD